MKSVLWFQPAYPGKVSLATFLTAFTTLQVLNSRGVQMGVSGISTHDIAWVRNFALTVFYDTLPNYTHLLMVDSDMAFPGEVVLDMLNFDEPVVGALYRKKNIDWDWAVSGIPNPETRGSFIEVEGLGAGCLLIRRDAVTTMLEKMPEISDDRPNTAAGFAKEVGNLSRIIRAFDQMDNEEGGVIAEDISFCRRFRACGGKVWGAGHHSIQHIGDYSFEGSYVDYLKTDHAKAAKAAADAKRAALSQAAE